MKKAYLVLSNGQIFEGEAIGAEGETIGEIVFTTGVVGYLETLTDPSYAGQIAVQTFPMIGNYGVIEDDFEGNCAVKGYVVREICDYPSNFRCQYDLDTFLKSHNIPGICGVDTREITRIIRESGVMNATICYSVPESLEKVKEYEIKGVVKEESTKEIYECPAVGEAKYNVVLIDYGAKRNIIRCLSKRGCNVTVVPCTTSAEDILAMNPDGLMLSNGPGDPEDNEYSITQIKKLIGKLPVFGICLGHQLTALAMGGKTIKLKYGHRGGNQPVKEVNGKRTYITSQNHGYAVVSDSLKGVGEELFVNANDGSCEGMNYPGLNCFTVQFHPEACSGPQDTEFLFDKFISMMGGKQNA